jgi:hypothetical protein
MVGNGEVACRNNHAHFASFEAASRRPLSFQGNGHRPCSASEGLSASILNIRIQITGLLQLDMGAFDDIAPASGLPRQVLVEIPRRRGQNDAIDRERQTARPQTLEQNRCSVPARSGFLLGLALPAKLPRD